MIVRVIAAVLSGGLIAMASMAPAAAQSAREVGEMRLYIQQLEEQIRHLTGENERLRFEVRQLQAQSGAPAQGQAVQQQVTRTDDGAIVRGTINPQNNASVEQGAAPQDLGTLSVSQDDPLIVSDGAGEDVRAAGDMQPGQFSDQPVAGGADAPLDLSALAGGQAGALDSQDLNAGGGLAGESQLPDASGAQDQAPQLTASISGSARDEYDLAYGYVLTGDYPLAEAHFSAWISAFPSHSLADDARFWMGESKLQQRKYQEAASAFLDLHKRVPNNSKGPDTLLKLGVALAGLGEKAAACATFSEVAKKYPDATGATMNRVANEQQRAKC
jgi:tol-pal system protein YbgF